MSDKVRVTSIEPVTGEHRGIPYAFVPAPSEMLRDPNLTMEEKGFLCILMLHARPQRDEFVVYPGIERIAALCTCSASKVQRLFRSVLSKGCITRHRQIKGSTRTDLTFIPSNPRSEPKRSGLTHTNTSGLTAEVDAVEVEKSIVASRRDTTGSPSKAGALRTFVDRVISAWNEIIAEPEGRPLVTPRTKAITEKLRARWLDPNWDNPEAVMRACVPLSDFMAGRESFRGITLMTLVQNAKGAQNALDGLYRANDAMAPCKPHLPHVSELPEE